MYIVVVLFIIALAYAAFSLYVSRASGGASGADFIKLGFSMVMGVVPFIPRAEIIKRREKISALRAIRIQYYELNNLEKTDKDFVMTQLQGLMIQTLNKI
jgi:hypothetical protein